MSRKQNRPPATAMPPSDSETVGEAHANVETDADAGTPSEPTGKETTATTDVSASSEASALPPAPNASLDTPVMAFDQGRSGWLTPPAEEAPPTAFDQGPEGWKGDAVEETVAPTATFDALCLSQNRHVPNCECTGVARKPISA